MARKGIVLHTREIARIDGTDTLIVIDLNADGTYRAGFTTDGGETIEPVVEAARNANIALRDALLSHPDGYRRYPIEGAR